LIFLINRIIFERVPRFCPKGSGALLNSDLRPTMAARVRAVFCTKRVGGTSFFSLGERKYCLLEHFWSLLAHRRHRNAQKLFKKAGFDHFELIIGTFGKISLFLHVSPIFVDFSN
jgi:hypothetical protein